MSMAEIMLEARRIADRDGLGAAALFLRRTVADDAPVTTNDVA